MQNQPRKNNQILNALNEKLTTCFTDLLQAKPGWTRPTDEQFVQALAESVVATGNKVKDGRGVAMLQTFVYDLQDLINAGIFDRDNSEIVIPVKLLPKPIFQSSTHSTLSKLEIVVPWDSNQGFNQQSPLFKMGYSVAENGPLLAKRREILSQAFNEDSLPALVSADDKNRWGAAKSAQRLYAICKFITWLCNFQGKEKPTARQSWMGDLGWLKKQYFRESMQFVWPDMDVKRSLTVKRVPNAAFMEALTLSPALAAVVGAACMPRTEIVSKLWVYIKKNKLQDLANKRMINADAKLLEIFGKSQVSMFEMAGLIGKHVT
jgi:upstream activation factor subunit UAF30